MEERITVNKWIIEHKKNLQLGLVDKSKTVENIWFENDKFYCKETKIIKLYKHFILTFY